MALNVRLLRRIQRHILAEPGRLDMSSWAQDVSSRASAPSCGTTACIAGWAVILTEASKRKIRNLTKQLPYEIVPDNYTFDEDAAARLLGFDSENGAPSLFLVAKWPLRIRARYETGRTPAARAKAASDAIDWAIKEHAKEASKG